MINILLLSCILIFILYALYDQFGMDKLKGRTLLKIKVKKRSIIDAIIFTGLIILLIVQKQGKLPAFTIYLLACCILLGIYITVIRYPQILFKKEGLFFNNIFIPYEKIAQVNISTDHFLVIDLNNKKRINAKLININDEKQILKLFNAPIKK